MTTLILPTRAGRGRVRDHGLTKPSSLLRQVTELRDAIDGDGRVVLRAWRRDITRTAFLRSARNLADYLALRARDIRGLQRELAPWGLSSLGRSESRVLPTVDAVAATLSAIAGSDADVKRPSPASLRWGERRLAANTRELFGPPRPGRDIRVMVTMPSEAADDYPFVLDLVRRGMDCARINCAHDDEDTWERIVTNVRRAAREAAVSCCVSLDLCGPRLRTTSVHRLGDRAKVMVGDVIALGGTDEPVPGVAFSVGCSIPSVIRSLKRGEHVWMDDGKLGAVVKEVRPTWAELQITQTPPKGVKLAPEKGLNFPDSDLGLGALTNEDRSHLDFVVRQADLIGYSFVQDASDVASLQSELLQRVRAGARLPALIAKIETQRAVANLPAIIVRAAGRQPLGVMIARGDLAVEIGFERLAEIQEEILWLCEAAHIPVIWATQVLERLVKKGTPSRAEITDAAMAERAECVMLNKGPHLARGIELLSDVLTRMESHQHKKTPQLRALRVWRDSVPLSS